MVRRLIIHRTFGEVRHVYNMCDLYVTFLSRVSTLMLTRDIDIRSVRPSDACLSIRNTLVLGIVWKQLHHIVIVFSPYGSPTILVLPASNIFAKFRRCHPLRGRGVWKCRNFRPITCYTSEIFEDRLVYAARRFTSIESSFQPYVWHLSRLSQGRTQGGQNVQKYAKMANVWIYGLNYHGKRLLTIDEYMLWCFKQHWILFPSMWHLPRFSQGRTQGRPKCVLDSLDVANANAKRVKATTCRRDSPEVAKLWLRLVFMQPTRDQFAIVISWTNLRHFCDDVYCACAKSKDC